MKTTEEDYGPFSLSFLSQTSTHLVCSVKLVQTSSSLSCAKLSKLSSKHRATQSKLEPKLVLFKANTVAVYSLQKQTKKETPGQHSLTPSSRRSTPTRPNFHTPSCRSDEEVKLLAFQSKIQTILRYGLLGSRLCQPVVYAFVVLYPSDFHVLSRRN